ncbi:hypothetical protein D1007_60309 [Hordeum vulgare]|nr:hypothetical protein D1007_60309 [Hordeum vulgare]
MTEAEAANAAVWAVVEEEAIRACILKKRVVVDDEEGLLDLPHEYADHAILVSKVGKIFMTERDAFNLYNIYDVRIGFGIRLSKLRYNAAKKLNNCQQMAASIAKVFPKASHRVCKWHILKKVRENCGNIYSIIETFKEDFHRVLTQMLIVDEFEGAWKELMSEYKLEDCVYLKQMWDIREKWAFPYFGHLFYAGMTTTQRSESVNFLLKREYVLKRWRKDARERVPSFVESYKDYVDAAASQMCMHLVLHTTSEEVTRLGNKSMKAYKVAMEDLNQLVENLRKVILEEEQANMEGAEMQAEEHNQDT